MSDHAESTKRASPEPGVEPPAKKPARGNLAVRDRAECLAKLAPYKELVKDSRAASPRDLDWKMGEGRSAGELVVYNKVTGRETAVLEGYGEAKIFTSDPEKLNVKLSLDPHADWDRSLVELFSKKLPRAILQNLKALTSAKDGCKPLISKKQAKVIQEKADSDGIEKFIWEEIILDESGAACHRATRRVAPLC
jgi:hypothetical protein